MDLGRRGKSLIDNQINKSACACLHVCVCVCEHTCINLNRFEHYMYMYIPAKGEAGGLNRVVARVWRSNTEEADTGGSC